MSNIQSRLDSLQPYVIGIRYFEGLPIADVILKENWNIPESDIILKTKGDEKLNYWVFY